MVRLTGKDLLRLLQTKGCEVMRQRGSHVRVRCDQCFTTIPLHAGETLRKGLLHKIKRDLEPCLGKGWLTE